jgi:hypothetical protein
MSRFTQIEPQASTESIEQYMLRVAIEMKALKIQRNANYASVVNNDLAHKPIKNLCPAA